jgi:uncharacterized protein YkwD
MTALKKFVLIALVIGSVILIPTTTLGASTSFYEYREYIRTRMTNINSEMTFRKVNNVSATTPKPSSTTNTTNSVSNNSLTQQVVTLVNKERANANLNALTINTSLQTSAQNYSTQMANQNFFSHTAPNGETFQQRIIKAGYTNYRWIAENIAAGQSTSEEVMRGWMNSTGHRNNILNPNAKEVGIGYAQASHSTYRHYWTQHFGAK